MKKNLFIKLICMLLVMALLAFSGACKGCADNKQEQILNIEQLIESKHRLVYNEDGSFRVMTISDTHMNVLADSVEVKSISDRIKTLVDRVNPNLIIFTGDNTINSNTKSRLHKNIDALVGYIEQRKIPWCHVYGNHDHENALSNEEQQSVWQEYDYCVSKDVTALSGTGNYVLGVYTRNAKLGSLIWCLDSGAYDNGGYDYIKQDQIDWYKKTSLEINNHFGGKVIKGIMAFHIPLIENKTANELKDLNQIVYEYSGNVNENICSSETDTNLLETIFELGNVKAIVTGHDHVNDYMFNYKGVKLCSSPNVSKLTYYDANIQGCRVFDLNLQTIDNIPTYVEYLKNNP